MGSSLKYVEFDDFHGFLNKIIEFILIFFVKNDNYSLKKLIFGNRERP